MPTRPLDPSRPLRALLLAAPVLLLGCEEGHVIGGGGGDAGNDAGAPFSICSVLPAASLDELYPAAFAVTVPTGCAGAGCHGTGQGGMMFTDAKGFYAATVNQPAQSDPSLMRVKPGDPEHSLLFQRLSASAAVRMPSGGPYLDDWTLLRVEGWICAGAPPPSGMDGGQTDGGMDAGTPPTVDSFTPTSGIVGDPVTIHGSGFSSTALDNVVDFNGALATVLSADAGTLETAVPAGATTGKISVTVSGMRATSATDFTVIPSNPVPAITAAQPAAVDAGSPDTVVQLTGTGFLSSSTAQIDGAQVTSSFTSPTQLSMTLSAATLAAAGTHQLTVSNPAPGGGTSAGFAFDVLNPPPSLSAINPTTVPTGGAAFTLSVTGTGFNASSVVHFNGSPVTTTFVSSTSLGAAIPSLTTAGSFPVEVVNPSPGGGTSGAINLVAQTVTTPYISGLSPSPAVAGAAFTLTVTGANFTCSGAGPVVLFNSTTLPSATCASTQLTASVPSTSAGNYAVQVRNPNNDLSNIVSLTLQAPNPVPALSSLAPSSGSTGGAGFTLTANGSSFVSGAVLSFNGSARTTTFVSASQVTAAIPSSDLATAGSYPVVVSNPTPGGGASNTLSFAVVTQNPLPAITSLSPSAVVAGSGAANVTINGSGFIASSAAFFNGASRTTTYVSPTQLTIALTSADTTTGGNYPITVTNPTPGGGTSNAVNLGVGSPVPAVSALSPCGVVAGAASFNLSITGSGFVSGSTATFNGVPVTLTYNSATSLSAAIPASLVASAPSTDAVDVVVSNPTPGGGPSNAYSFGIASKVSTLSANVQTVFTSNCITGCHSATTQAGGLVLASGSAAANLIGVASTGCAGEIRVVKCQPLRSQSVLIDKIMSSLSSPPCAGSPMPKTGSLTAAEKQTILDWVAQGAP